MNVWEKKPGGSRRFRPGRDNHPAAAQAARLCAWFVPDDEDECCSDEARSCYNCRYRRWTIDSFDCLRG